MKRVDGKDGWKKMYCPWSFKTWHAWGKWDEIKQKYICTCDPCRPPKKEAINANRMEGHTGRDIS